VQIFRTTAYSFAFPATQPTPSTIRADAAVAVEGDVGAKLGFQPQVVVGPPAETVGVAAGDDADVILFEMVGGASQPALVGFAEAGLAVRVCVDVADDVPADPPCPLVDDGHPLEVEDDPVSGSLPFAA
jgi:hypothetical protein